MWSVCTIALVSGGMRRFYVDLRRVTPRSWSMQRKIGRPAAKQNLLPQNKSGKIIYVQVLCVVGWVAMLCLDENRAISYFGQRGEASSVLL